MQQSGERQSQQTGSQQGSQWGAIDHDQQSHQGQQSGEFDQGLAYGGEARHSHDDEHVGAGQTFGSATEHEQRQSDMTRREQGREEYRQ